MSLWDYLITPSMQSALTTTFKCQERFLQAKATLINNGTEVLAVCTDITKSLELEKQGQILRAQFFSSIAHELRTPLNSVIPVLKLVISQLTSTQTPDIGKIVKLISIAYNGTVHLESVVHDALDITRLENNKFEIHKSPFKVRDLIAEIADIMKF